MTEDFDNETSEWLESNDVALDACESAKPDRPHVSTRKRVSVARVQLEQEISAENRLQGERSVR